MFFFVALFRQASKTPLSVYLFGTYAKQAQELVRDDDVMGIVKFRTVSMLNNNDDKTTQMHNLRKRNSRNDDDNSLTYSYSIVVDSLSDMEMISSSLKVIHDSSNVEGIKIEQNHDKDIDLEVVSILKNDNLNELQSLFNNTIRLDQQFEDKWAPFLSFCQNWRAPDDPKNLNQSLYIFQPCVPKFESASSTVKM